MEEPKKKKLQLPEQLKKDVKEMSNALSRALQFMTTVINDDTQMFEEYYREHGDIKWRPKLNDNADERGEPTELDMVMKADSMGLAVKRLIDTIAVIEARLGALDPASEERGYSSEEEAEHKIDTQSRAQKLLEAAASKKAKG